MKHNFLNGLFLNLVGMISSVTFAGGIECRTCPCPEGFNYIPKSNCNIMTPGQFARKVVEVFKAGAFQMKPHTI
jgi:hypothetical protein